MNPHLHWPAFEAELADWTRLARQADALVARCDFGRLPRHLDVLHARLTMQRALDARAVSAELELVALRLLGRVAVLRERARARSVPLVAPRLAELVEGGAGGAPARRGEAA
jgi:hypothetical protein